MAQDNLWRVVSRGFAAENKELDDIWIRVYCPELSGFASGEITSDIVEKSTQGVDAMGHNYTCKIKTSNTIKAKWRQQGTNRVTAPDVRRGERLEIWQYADADVYYWSNTGEDDHLRRKETVSWAFSNTEDESTAELTKDNTYGFTVSTHQKKVEMTTSKSDGEPFAHTVQLDTKRGLFTYKDDKGNVIQVNSEDDQIFIENAAGSQVVIDGGVIKILATDRIEMKAKTVNLEASEFNVNAKTNINGDVSTKGSLRNNGTNVGSTHKHGGTKRGDSNTDTPN